jgi:uncharacterized RDD family membrane protein YckC
LTITDESGHAPPQIFQPAGFWRRFFAFCLDGILLGIVGALFGLLAFDYLASFGSWGRAIGFVISLAYFGVLESSLSGGQSAGKRITKIKVINAAGMPLSVGICFLRTLIFCVPYFLNGAQFPNGMDHVLFMTLLSVLVLGLGISTIYLLIFNARTRQSLADLIVGSFVVPVQNADSASHAPVVWRGHLIVVAVIMAVSLLLPIVSQRFLTKAPFAGLLPVQRALQELPDVRYVNLTVFTNTAFVQNQGSTTRHVVTAQLFIRRPLTSYNSLANQAAQIVLRQYPEANAQDSISIFILYGYDIGIASGWRNRVLNYSPAQWHDRLESKSVSEDDHL